MTDIHVAIVAGIASNGTLRQPDCRPVGLYSLKAPRDPDDVPAHADGINRLAASGPGIRCLHLRPDIQGISELPRCIPSAQLFARRHWAETCDGAAVDKGSSKEFVAGWESPRYNTYLAITRLGAGPPIKRKRPLRHQGPHYTTLGGRPLVSIFLVSSQR